MRLPTRNLPRIPLPRIHLPRIHRGAATGAVVALVVLLIAAFVYWFPRDATLLDVEPDDSPPVTLADYRDRLAAALAALEEVNPMPEAGTQPDANGEDAEGETAEDETAEGETAEGDSAAPQYVPMALAQARLAEIRAELATVRRVALPNGDVVIVTPILGEDPELAEEEPREESGESTGSPFAPTFGRDRPLTVPNAIARLRLAIAQIDAAPHDNTEARLAALQTVLARQEFVQPFNLWQRIQRWLRNLIRRLLAIEQPDGIANPGLLTLAETVAWVVIVVAAIAIVFFLTYWLQRILGNFVADAEARAAALDGDDFPLSSQDARRQARTAAEAGDYRTAVRRLYLSALLLLDERRLIRYDRSLTNREVLAQLPPENPARGPMEPVVETFDRVWYGLREPDAATFAAYEAEIDQLAELARHAPQPAAEAPQDSAQEPEKEPEKETGP